jgi:tripartite-type tricarboxylate transporter receptor subunit TctC
MPSILPAPASDDRQRKRSMTKWPLVLAFAATLATISPAAAQPYPSRPITIVVPFPAGGVFDTVVRIIADRMKSTLAQPIIIENVGGGAGGSVGVGRVARASPDGYTIGLGYWGTHVVNAAVYPLPYDPLKDFEPISPIATNPAVIVSKNALPAENLRELIAWLKTHSDKATLATVGSGSPPHIAGLLFQKMANTRFQFVPYRGGALAMQDLLAGQVDLSIVQATIVLPQVSAGKVKAYAVTAKTRLDAAPDIPTVDEAGLPGLYVDIWSGLWAPKGTPKDVIAKLNGAVVDALADARIRQRLAEIGQEIFPREQQTPEALAALQKEQSRSGGRSSRRQASRANRARGVAGCAYHPRRMWLKSQRSPMLLLAAYRWWPPHSSFRTRGDIETCRSDETPEIGLRKIDGQIAVSVRRRVPCREYNRIVHRAAIVENDLKAIDAVDSQAHRFEQIVEKARLGGRPTPLEIRQLIPDMSRTNSLWSAPRRRTLPIGRPPLPIGRPPRRLEQEQQQTISWHGTAAQYSEARPSRSPSPCHRE